MDLIGLLKKLTSTGISDFVFLGVILVVVRYWFSETRREISKEIDDKVGSARTDFQESFQEMRQEIRAVKTSLEESIKENRLEIGAVRTETRQEIREARTDSSQAHKETRQEINAVRAYTEQSHKETMLHLIDVRERLANIEGRLGAPTPRMSAVSPPLEAPADEPSAQS